MKKLYDPAFKLPYLVVQVTEESESMTLAYMTVNVPPDLLEHQPLQQLLGLEVSTPQEQMLKHTLLTVLAATKKEGQTVLSSLDEFRQAQHKQTTYLAQVVAALNKSGCVLGLDQKPQIHNPHRTGSDISVHTLPLATAEAVLSLSVAKETVLQASRSELKTFLATRAAQTDLLRALTNGQDCASLLMWKGRLDARHDGFLDTVAAAVSNKWLENLISSKQEKPALLEQYEQALLQAVKALKERQEIDAQLQMKAQLQVEAPHTEWTPERKALNKIEILKREAKKALEQTISLYSPDLTEAVLLEHIKRTKGKDVAQGVAFKAGLAEGLALGLETGLAARLAGMVEDQPQLGQCGEEGLQGAEIVQTSKEENINVKVRVCFEREEGLNEKEANNIGCSLSANAWCAEKM